MSGERLAYERPSHRRVQGPTIGAAVDQNDEPARAMKERELWCLHSLHAALPFSAAQYTGSTSAVTILRLGPRRQEFFLVTSGPRSTPHRHKTPIPSIDDRLSPPIVLQAGLHFVIRRGYVDIVVLMRWRFENIPRLVRGRVVHIGDYDSLSHRLAPAPQPLARMRCRAPLSLLDHPLHRLRQAPKRQARPRRAWAAAGPVSHADSDS